MINRGFINTTIKETYCCERKITEACKKCVKDLVDGKVEVEKCNETCWDIGEKVDKECQSKNDKYETILCNDDFAEKGALKCFFKPLVPECKLPI